MARQFFMLLWWSLFAFYLMATPKNHITAHHTYNKKNLDSAKKLYEDAFGLSLTGHWHEAQQMSHDAAYMLFNDPYWDYESIDVLEKKTH